MLEVRSETATAPEYPSLIKEAIGEPLWSRIEEYSFLRFNPVGIDKLMTKTPLLKGKTSQGERFLACKYIYPTKEGKEITDIFFLYTDLSNEWIGEAINMEKFMDCTSSLKRMVYFSPAHYFPKGWNKNPSELTQRIVRKFFNFDECGLYAKKIGIIDRTAYGEPFEDEKLQFYLGMEPA